MNPHCITVGHVGSKSSGERTARPFGGGFKSRQSLVLLGGMIWLSIFLSLSVRLVANRHYQVDEFEISYDTILLSDPSLREFTLLPLPFMVPLGYLAHQFHGTTDILLAFRLVFLLVLIVNLVIAVSAQPFFSHLHQRLVCLVALSGFVTFWRHGLEIRHDNLALTGCLSLYGLTVRSQLGKRRRQPLRDLGAGIAFVWLLTSAYKGFVLAVPFLVLFLWASWQRRRRLGQTLAWSTFGAAFSAVLLAVLLRTSDTTASFLRGVEKFFDHLGDIDTFSHWPRFLQLASSYPHVAGLAVLAVVGALWRARKRPWKLTTSTVNVCYFLCILAFLEINPKPFPYNFLFVVPFMFFCALEGARRLGRRVRGRPAKVAAATVLTGATLLGGLGLWQRDFYFDLSNEYQLSYIEAAESVTDPQSDSILDGVGMVLTRRPPLKDWLLHGSFINAYAEGRRQSFADLIRIDPPPVVFTSYRWGGLETEWRLLEERYVQVGKDFWLLGKNLVPGNGRLDIHRTGRYQLFTKAEEEIRLDGRTLRVPAVAHLQKGTHKVDGLRDQPILVHWIGPAEDLRFRPLPSHLSLVGGIL